MNNKQRELEIVKGRNKIIINVTFFSLVLSVINNYLAGLPINFIIMIAITGFLMIISCVIMNKKENLSRGVTYIILLLLTSLTYIMVSQDHQLMLSYFMVFFNIIIVALCQNYRPIVLTGFLQMVLTGIFYHLYSDTLFLGYKPEDMSSFYMYIMLFTAILSYQAQYSSKIQRQAFKNENEALESKIKNELILSEVEKSVEQLDDFEVLLQSTIEETSNISESVSEHFNSLKLNMNNQFQNINHINKSIKMNDENIGEISNDFKVMKNLSTESVRRTNLGQEKMNKVLETNDKVSEVIELTNEVMMELNKKNGQISNIIKTLNEISEKISVLSLNARIEAARAGDSGAGFSVVAEEVKRLSEQSQTSTNEITDILRDISDFTRKSSEQVSSGRDVVLENKERTMELLETLNQIIENTQNVLAKTDFNDKKVTTMNENSKVILEDVNKVEALTKENKQFVEEVNGLTLEQQEKTTEISIRFKELEQNINKLKETIKK